MVKNLSKLIASLKGYNTIQYNTIQYNTIQYNTIQYNTIQYNTIQYNTIQYNTIQYNTIQYNTIQYNTIQYNTVPKVSKIVTISSVFVLQFNKSSYYLRHMSAISASPVTPSTQLEM